MAAQRLGISARQCRRLLVRYREDGPLGIANQRRGKPSNNQLPSGLSEYALTINSWLRPVNLNFDRPASIPKIPFLPSWKRVESPRNWCGKILPATTR